MAQRQLWGQRQSPSKRLKQVFCFSFFGYSFFSNFCVGEEELRDLLLNLADANAKIWKQKLMAVKHMDYSKKREMTMKLFDSILAEEGMLHPRAPVAAAAVPAPGSAE